GRTEETQRQVQDDKRVPRLRLRITGLRGVGAGARYSQRCELVSEREGGMVTPDLARMATNSGLWWSVSKSGSTPTWSRKGSLASESWRRAARARSVWPAQADHSAGLKSLTCAVPCFLPMAARRRRA